MERRKIIALAVVALGIIGWHVGAMQQGESSSSGPREIILETKDGLETRVGINTARLFGFINTSINERPDYSMVTLRTITKPVLDRLLASIPSVLRHYQTNDPAIILGMTLEERRNKMPSQDDPLARMTLQQKFELLQAAYDLEMPELIAQYGMGIASLLKKTTSAELLNNGDYTLVTIIQQQPAEVQNIIKEWMGKTYTGLVSSRNLQSIDTVEKELWLTLLAVYERNDANDLKATSWVMGIWRDLSENDKEKIRKGYPRVAQKLDRLQHSEAKAAWLKK
jgi:hypothetical protein